MKFIACQYVPQIGTITSRVISLKVKEDKRDLFLSLNVSFQILGETSVHPSGPLIQAHTHSTIASLKPS